MAISQIILTGFSNVGAVSVIRVQWFAMMVVLVNYVVDVCDGPADSRHSQGSNEKCQQWMELARDHLLGCYGVCSSVPCHDPLKLAESFLNCCKWSQDRSITCRP